MRRRNIFLHIFLWKQESQADCMPIDYVFWPGREHEMDSESATLKKPVKLPDNTRSAATRRRFLKHLCKRGEHVTVPSRLERFQSSPCRFTNVMEVDPTSPVSSQPYTILRIKRKRNEEPLDALGKRFSMIVLCPGE